MPRHPIPPELYGDNVDRRPVWQMTERLVAHQVCFKRAMFLLTILLAVLIGVRAASNEDRFFVDDDLRPSFVHHGYNGCDLTIKAPAFDCDELELRHIDRQQRISTIDRLFEFSAHFLASGMKCVCAPMFGMSRRHVAINANDGGSTPLHMFNPDLTIDRTSGTTTLRERQPTLFPDANVTSVLNARYNTLTVSYLDLACNAMTATVHRDRAWCIQVCVDLLDGHSVYDRGSVE